MKHSFLKRALALTLSAAMLFAGCGTKTGETPQQEAGGAVSEETAAAGTEAADTGADAETEMSTEADPQLVVNAGDDGFPIVDLASVSGADAVSEPDVIDDNYRMYYEIFVYSFCDSNGDGVGDLQGVIRRLDYIQDLGCNGIWLMPVMPSTTYHKYDVTDYYDIDAEYGTLDDFKQLVAECDKRGIKVIIDMVVNHTSASHEWFQTAAEYLRGLEQGAEPDLAECPYVGYYHFSRENGSGYAPLSGTDWYYEAQFWDQMPDLNLDNEAVRGELEKVMKYWADLGVGGFRLDAAKEYFSGNPDKNIEVLSWINDYCKSLDENFYLVAEVWDSFDTIEKYYASGIDSFFNFQFGGNDGTLVQNMLSAGDGASGKSLAEKMVECQDRIQNINARAIDAPFLSNHDVGRIAGFLRHEPDKMKFAGAVNILMGGSAFLYYGEELGMDGSVKGSAGKDENKRAPMYWYGGAGDAEDWADVDFGMTNGPADMDDVEHQFGDYTMQMGDADSIYNYYRKLIGIRNAFPQIARGTETVMDEIADGDLCALKKTYKGETTYLIMNDSAEEKQVTLSLEGVALLSSLTTQSGQQTSFADGVLTLPPYGIALLK